MASSEIWNSRLPAANSVQGLTISKLLKWEAGPCTEERWWSLAPGNKGCINEWTTETLCVALVKETSYSAHSVGLAPCRCTFAFGNSKCTSEVWSFSNFCQRRRKSFFFFSFNLCLAFPFFSQAVVRNCTSPAYSCEVQSAKVGMPSVRASGWTQHCRTRGCLAHFSWLLRTWEGHGLTGTPSAGFKSTSLSAKGESLSCNSCDSSAQTAAEQRARGCKAPEIWELLQRCLLALFHDFWFAVPVLLRAHSPVGINPRIPFRQGKYFNVFKLGWRSLP